jgi:hypothetical protein
LAANLKLAIYSSACGFFIDNRAPPPSSREHREQIINTAAQTTVAALAAEAPIQMVVM